MHPFFFVKKVSKRHTKTDLLPQTMMQCHDKLICELMIKQMRHVYMCVCVCDVGDDDGENQQRPPSHTHLPCLVIVFDLTQISAAGLSDPLPRHQIPDHHRRRTDL